VVLTHSKKPAKGRRWSIGLYVYASGRIWESCQCWGIREGNDLYSASMDGVVPAYP